MAVLFEVFGGTSGFSETPKACYMDAWVDGWTGGCTFATACLYACIDGWMGVRRWVGG